MKLSVIIPAHNEQDNIGPTLKSFAGRLEAEGIPHEIVVVDDHSTDATGKVVQEVALSLPQVVYLQNPFDGGVGNAIQWGLKNFSGDCVSLVMADASDNPDDLCVYYRTMVTKKVDCVFGSRFMPGARLIDYPRHKLLLNRIFNFVVKIIFQHGYNDTTNAFKLYTRETVEGLYPILSKHFNIMLELPLKAVVRGHSFVVVSSDWTNRAHGVSKLKIKEMGSRYLFIMFYCLLEKLLVKKDYHAAHKDFSIHTT